MKKIVSLLMVLVTLLATQMPVTPIYAAPAHGVYYDTATKKDSWSLIGVYKYQLNIVDGKLIATGTYNRREDPTKLAVKLQLVKPVTTDWYIDANGLACVAPYKNRIETGRGWELKTAIPVVRSASSTGDTSISMEIDLSGLADGIYNLHEIISKGGKNEGHFGSYTYLVVHKGTISLQTTWIYGFLTSWWHDDGFWIS